MRPNILIIMTDQMRSTAMGCAGVESVRTPNLDRLAAGGTRFTNAVTNTPACTPARATFLTGKHVLGHRLVTNDVQLGHQHQSLAHGLNQAGYHCAYIGKWHLDGVNRGAFIPPGPRRQGFDDYWAGTECNHRYFQGYYYSEAGTPVWFDGYEPDGQTDLAVDYLRRQTAADPFCLVVSWSPPHCPYHLAPQRFLELYPPERINYLPNAEGATIQASETKGGLPQPADLSAAEHDQQKRKIIAGYYAHISAMDAGVGRLLGTLDELHLADNTIVIFTSDHGDMLFSHNRGWKTKPWRESVGIPLLCRWPGRIPIRTSNAPVSLVDLMPTLLGLSGVDVPKEVEGLDLSQLVLGDESAAPVTQYINFPCMPQTWSLPEWRGVVSRTHTYVETRSGPWLLFDDRADPFQMTNLVDSPAAVTVQQELQRALREWLVKTHDPFAPATVVADEYLPRHTNNITCVPPLDPVIAAGQQARAANVY